MNNKEFLSFQEKKVVYVEDLFHLIYQVHEEIGHMGGFKTFDRVRLVLKIVLKIALWELMPDPWYCLSFVVCLVICVHYDYQK